MEALQKANAELAEKAQAVSSAVRSKQKGVLGSWRNIVLRHRSLLRTLFLSCLSNKAVELCPAGSTEVLVHNARPEVSSMINPFNRRLHCLAELQALECSLTVEEIAAKTEELQSQVGQHPQRCPQSSQTHSA